MKRYFCKPIIVALLICAGALIAIFIPNIYAITDEEAFTIQYINEADDEGEVSAYLDSQQPLIRKAVSVRLGEIGTSNFLCKLEDIINTDDDYEVRYEAAFSLWKIRYREDLKDGGNGTGILFSIFGDDGDISKTAKVKGWAIEILGNEGCNEAVLFLEDMLASSETTICSDYLRKIAKENLIKIEFINDHTPEEVITLGLEHEELSIRKLALDRLVKSKPLDLMDRLKALLLNAQEKEDIEFASYIAQALQAEIEETRYPPLQIVTPNGITVKTPWIYVSGYTYGEYFTERVNLVPGENTYIKTITKKDGGRVSESIRIYFNNQLPILSPIGNKEVCLGQTLTFTISATDPDDTNLLYFVYPYPLPEGMNFNYDTQTVSWTPKADDIGRHEITFETDDGYGRTDEETITIEVTAPALLVIDPTPEDKDTVGGTVHVEVKGEGFYYVYLYGDDNVFIGWDNKAPYRYDWDTTYFTNGKHTLKAMGYNRALGRWVESEPLEVNVYNENPNVPSVTITNITEGQTITGDVKISATVSHPAKMRYVVFYLDERYIGYDWYAPFEVTLPSQYYENGPHTLKAISYFYGPPYIMCEDTVNITIDNAVQKIPTISIDNLTNNQKVSGTITIKASGSDPSYMRYFMCYIDKRYLGYDFYAPYRFTWPTRYFENGPHTVTVKGYHMITHRYYEKTVTVDLRNPTEPITPTVTITNLINGQTISGTQTFTVALNDAKNIRYVSLLIDNRYNGYAYAAPYTIKLDTTRYSNGIHKFKAMAYHKILMKFIYSDEVVLDIKNGEGGRNEK